jgi:two-component sensor histidine kinase
MLVNMLTNQLGGSLEINRENGTEFQITFSTVRYGKKNL